MILLLGGISESIVLARKLLAANQRVIFCTATSTRMDLPSDPRLERRCGAMELKDIVNLVHERGVQMIVDCTHPYAIQVTANAIAAAKQTGVPYLAYSRPGMVDPASRCAEDRFHLARDHAHAARLAFGFGRPVLITTGSRNIAVYANESRQTGIPCFARVLPASESASTCQAAGLAPENIIAARGPFTREQNLLHLREHDIGVMVTKDSGQAGGVDTKLQAARELHCEVVVVTRPQTAGRSAFNGLDELAEAISLLISSSRS